MGAIIAELYYRNLKKPPSEYIYNNWEVLMCLGFVQTLSIITACLPYLKPFFSSLQANMIQNSEFHDSDYTPSQTEKNGKSKPVSLRSRLTKSFHSPLATISTNKSTATDQFEMSTVGLAVNTPQARRDNSDLESQHSRVRILNSSTPGHAEHSVM